MKKVIIAVIFGLIIIPQVTLAAWWKPSTWPIFNQFLSIKTSTPKSSPTSESVRTTSSSNENLSLVKTQPASVIINLRLPPSSSFDTTILIDWSKVKKAEVSSTIPAGLSSFNQARLALSGVYDFSNQKKLSIASLLSLKISFLEASLEARVIGNTLYGRITKLPPLPITNSLIPYKNQWIAFGRQGTDDLSSKIPSLAFIQTPSNIINRLTPDQQKRLSDLTTKANFIKITKRLAPTNINGTTFDHVLFELDQSGLQKYAQELKDYFRSVAKINSPLASLDPVIFYDKNIGKIKDFSGEALIDRRDHLPYKITTSFKLLVDQAKEDKGFWQINSVSVFTNRDQVQTITAPVGSKTIGELSVGS